MTGSEMWIESLQTSPEEMYDVEILHAFMYFARGKYLKPD